MNRQLTQILIGAAVLTGAFFFGSSMQRRHGDLEHRQSSLPLLENEDLVWHTAKEQPKEERKISQPPQSTVAEATANRPAPAAPASEPGSQLKSADEAIQADRPELDRKIVQPDFSRWAEPNLHVGSPNSKPRPLLPQAEPPPLLEEITQPAGELRPATGDSQALHDAGSAPSPSTPAPDPWTAPLSSVLRPTSAPPADAIASQPRGQRAEGNNAAELVPVNLPWGKKVEVNTDSFRIHQIRSGDTLQSIAQRYYGSPDYYLDIYLANQDQLESPIRLPPGKSLKIPDQQR